MNTRYIIIIAGAVIVLSAGGFLFLQSRSQTPVNTVSVANTETTAIATDTSVLPQHETTDTPLSEPIPAVTPSTPPTENGAPKTETPHNTTTQPTIASSVKKPITQDVSVGTTTGGVKKVITPTPVLSSKLDITTQLVNFGFAVPSKPRTIDTIILHTSYDATGSDPYSVSGIIAQWKNYGVAPHYFIGHTGTVYQIVKDENIAYHAGVSKMPDGRTNVNDFSIGIEMASTQKGDYTEEQYASLKKLIALVKEKHAIKYILGHNDIAPVRKTDPWNFDWKKLK